MDDIENKKEVEDEDISVKEGTISTPFSPNDIRLTTPPMNLGDLIDMIEAKWINFDADYQRASNLWDPDKQSRLIESVLLGLRLPAFYFEEISKREWNIIDGLQRCCTIKNFCVDDTLKLTGLEFLSEQFAGKGYKELSFETKRDIRMLPITVNVLDKATPSDVKYILFKRLNTGGISLTAPEIRNAMFQGKVSAILKEMASNTSFKEATDNRINSLRMDDQDFIARFITFYILNYNDFQVDLEKYIVKSLFTLRDKWTEKQIQEIKDNFEKAMKTAIDIFGNDAFRKRNDANAYRLPLNKAYFEVISTTFAKLSDDKRQQLLQKKNLLKNNLLVLMKNNAYWDSLSVGTGNKNSVIRRFEMFNDTVQQTLNDHKIRITDDNRVENSEL